MFKGLNQQLTVLGMLQQELIEINHPVTDEELVKAIKGLLECNVQISEVWKQQSSCKYQVVTSFFSH